MPLMTPEVGSMLRPCGRPEALYVIKRTSSPITAWRRRACRGSRGRPWLPASGGLRERPRPSPPAPPAPPACRSAPAPKWRRMTRSMSGSVTTHWSGAFSSGRMRACTSAESVCFQHFAEGGFGLGAEGGQLLGGGLAAVEVVGVQVGDEARQFGGRNPWNGSQSLAQPFRCGFGGLRHDLHGLIGLLGVIGRQVRPQTRKVAAFERVRGSIRRGAFQGEASNGAFPLSRADTVIILKDRRRGLLAIGRHRDVVDLGVKIPAAQLLAGQGLPQAHRFVRPAGQDETSVRRIRDGPHVIRMPFKKAEAFPGRQVPQLDGVAVQVHGVLGSH